MLPICNVNFIAGNYNLGAKQFPKSIFLKTPKSQLVVRTCFID